MCCGESKFLLYTRLEGSSSTWGSRGGADGSQHFPQRFPSLPVSPSLGWRQRECSHGESAHPLGEGARALSVLLYIQAKVQNHFQGPLGSPVAAWIAGGGGERVSTGWAPWANSTLRYHWLFLSPPLDHSCCWNLCPSRNGNWEENSLEIKSTGGGGTNPAVADRAAWDIQEWDHACRYFAPVGDVLTALTVCNCAPRSPQAWHQGVIPKLWLCPWLAQACGWGCPCCSAVCS